ncbi:MAG: 2-oxo-4-hydroxy-4-carboxy-5-ureidoimidazoline decarboxylase [Gemmatimonadaceae bacterium]
MTVAQLDALPAREAEELLKSCCGSRRWVHGMLGRRPFGDVASVVRAAEEVWWSLGPEDWRQAFAHHPRIGEREAAAEQGPRARAWSAGERRDVDSAEPDVRAALAAGNRDYERRFGHIYLVSAAGKTAEELLALLRARLSNDADTELRVAASEQAKITRLRLLELVGATDADLARSSTLHPPPSTLPQ